MKQEIRQILKNQVTILTALVDFKEIDLETINSIRNRTRETKEVLFPEQEPSLPSKTDGALSEDASRGK